jgi:hypothetical protein
MFACQKLIEAHRPRILFVASSPCRQITLTTCCCCPITKLMPHYSHHASTIRKLRNLFLRRLKFAVIQEAALIQDSDEDSIDDFVALSLVDFRSRRYSQDRGPYKQWNWRNFLEHTQQLSDTQFLLLFSMHRESFDLLQDLLKDHLVFCHCTGPAGNLLRQQYPVQLQIMVFLYSLGASSSDCNFKRIGARFLFLKVWQDC